MHDHRRRGHGIAEAREEAEVMNWWEGRLVAFDVETTGLDVEEARIVTATVAAVGGGTATEVVTLMADPGIPIPEEASAVHGVTTERARAEGKPAEEVVAEVLMELGAASLAGLPIVAYNARFDLTILDREARRHCAEDKSERVDWSGLTVIDPLVLDKHLDPYRKGSRRLEAACEHYRCRLDGAHDSAHDALAAARVAYRIGQTTELGYMTAPGLHDAQIEWAAEQARSLRDYFRQQGKTEAVASVREEWPVVPAP
jgi:DNA polymerase III epsilon subunit-like protein